MIGTACLAASAGTEWMHPALCVEVLRLGRALTGLIPNQSKVLDLQALRRQWR